MMNLISVATIVAYPLLDQELKEFLVAVLRTAGPFFFMGMQISSLQTAITIAKERSVGDLSPIPFLSLLMNGSVWFIYGSVKCDWTILVPNFTAVLVGAICVSLYHINAKERISLVLYGMVLSVIGSAIILGSKSDLRSLGLIGVFLSILLMGSPLSTVTIVVKEKRTDSMPFTTSFTTFLNCLAWTSYGYFVADDPMLWIPSFIGLILAILQLALFVIYGLPFSSEDGHASPKYVMVDLQVLIALSHCLQIASHPIILQSHLEHQII
jgi:solute carrier family 50 (sugar transporter)